MKNSEVKSGTMFLVAVVVMSFVFLWVVIALLPASEDDPWQEGYEVGLCTFYVGVNRDLPPTEARTLCMDEQFRDGIVDPTWET